MQESNTLDQKKLDKARQMCQKVFNAESELNDQEIEQCLNNILYNPLFEVDEILNSILTTLKKEIHEEKKTFENLRDKADKLNQEMSSYEIFNIKLYQ